MQLPVYEHGAAYEAATSVGASAALARGAPPRRGPPWRAARSARYIAYFRVHSRAVFS